MSRRWHAAWPGLLLVVLAGLAYANSFSADFVIDSRAIILDDPRLRAVTVANLRAIFSEQYWWPTAASDLYRPLTTLSYLFNYAVLGNGTNPVGYHAVNFLLHALNAILLWRLALRLTRDSAVAWFAAALFTVHPVGVEAVTNLVGRADLLATTAVLLAALMWLRARDPLSSHRRRDLTIAAAAAALGVLAKANGVMAAAAVGLLCWREKGWRAGARLLVREGWIVVVPALVTFALGRLWIHIHAAPARPVFVDNPIADAALGAGLMTAVGVLGRCFALLVWPAALSCDYSFPQIPLFGGGGWPDVVAWSSLALVIALAALCWLGRRAWPNVAFGVGWGALLLFPTSNLLVRIGSIMAERFLYLPLTGFALAGAALLTAGRRAIGSRTRHPRLALALPMLCVLALALRTRIRNLDWHDGRAIWNAALVVCPRSATVHHNLAIATVRDAVTEKNVDLAIRHAEDARSLLDAAALPPAREDNTIWPDLGSYYRVKGEFCLQRNDTVAAHTWFERSRAVLEKSVALNRWHGAELSRDYAARGDAAAAARTYGNPRIYDQLVLAELRLGRHAEAQANLAYCRQINPYDLEALEESVRIARDEGAWQRVVRGLLQVILLDRTRSRAWAELADAYQHIGIVPSPVNAAGKLDASSATVRRDLDSAALELVETFRAAGRPADADAWRARAVRDFGCSPRLFGVK